MGSFPNYLPPPPTSSTPTLYSSITSTTTTSNRRRHTQVHKGKTYIINLDANQQTNQNHQTLLDVLLPHLERD